MKTFSMVRNVFRFDLDCFNPEFTDNHLLVWVYLQRFSTYRDEINFCMGWLFDDLNINYRDTQKDLIKALFDLIEWELVKPIEDITKINRNTRIKLESVKYDNNFTKLLDSEIDKILYGDEDIRVKKTMLYVYTLIVSRIDDKRFCFPRRKTFKKDMQIKSNKRVQDAIDKLKELGLIDFAKAGIIRDAKGRIYNANNVYVTTYTENYSAILQNAVNSNREYHQENNSVVMQKKKREDTYSVAKEEDKTATVQVANGNNKVVDSDINVNVFEVFKQNGLNSIITQFISKNNISIEIMNNWLIDMENYFVSDEFLNMNNKKEMLKEILKTNIDVFEEEKINI